VNATVAFSVNPVTVVEGGPSAAVGVTVTNSFDTATGFVEIGKVEAGAYAPSVPGMYTIQYSGGGLTGSVEVVGGSSVLVELPVGTYVLSELDTPVNATVAFSVNPVTVVEGGPSAAVGVTVTNSFDTPG